MNKTKCPHCQVEIDPKATKCPHCQSDTRSWLRRHPIMSLLIVFILAPVFISQVVSEPSAEVSPTQRLDQVKLQNAEILAKSHVKKVPLKSPSTAKYNPPSTEVDAKNPNLFEVSSYLDSQNGFGAMIRTYWSMKLEFVGEDNEDSIDTGENWKIREFIFDGERIN